MKILKILKIPKEVIEKSSNNSSTEGLLSEK